MDRNIKEIQEVLDSPEQHDPAQVASAILKACDHWKNTLKSVYMKGVDGAPDWLEFEHNVWQLGESLRTVAKLKRWKGECPVLDSSARILEDDELGKGRQTFALLLGDFGKGVYDKVLGAALSDPEVAGHCVKSLIKTKNFQYEKEVQALFETTSGWIRTSAKKYLEKAKG